MEFLTLNNGIQMPLVGFGTFMLGGEICTEAVATAIQSGYRMIDTAEAYGNEKAVGEGIRSTKPEHIKENFELFDFTLSADEMSQLSTLDKKEPIIGKPETPEFVEFSLTW